MDIALTILSYFGSFAVGALVPTAILLWKIASWKTDTESRLRKLENWQTVGAGEHAEEVPLLCDKIDALLETIKEHEDKLEAVWAGFVRWPHCNEIHQRLEQRVTRLEERFNRTHDTTGG